MARVTINVFAGEKEILHGVTAWFETPTQGYIDWPVGVLRDNSHQITARDGRKGTMQIMQHEQNIHGLNRVYFTVNWE